MGTEKEETNPRKNKTGTVNEPKGNTEKKNQIGRKWKNSDTTDRYMVVLTGVIAFLTFGIVTFTVLQISKYTDAVHLENRAYVFPQRPATVAPLNFSGIKIPFINYGKTPARKFCAYIRYVYWDSIPENPKNWRYYSTLLQKTLAPQYPDTEVVWADSSMYWKREGKHTYFVYGKLFYDDFFGEQHWTSFAFYFEFLRGNVFVIYAGYDATDEDE